MLLLSLKKMDQLDAIFVTSGKKKEKKADQLFLFYEVFTLFYISFVCQ